MHSSLLYLEVLHFDKFASSYSHTVVDPGFSKKGGGGGGGGQYYTCIFIFLLGQAQAKSGPKEGGGHVPEMPPTPRSTYAMP